MVALPLICLVLSITDGDTLKVRCDDTGPEVVVRINSIDAPDKRQPFGDQSRKSLSKLCARQTIAVRQVDTEDDDDRIVADVQCRGVDAGQHQVALGMAWVADHDAHPRHNLHTFQDAARLEKLGLWAGDAPQPPWEWRRQHPAKPKKAERR